MSSVGDFIVNNPTISRGEWAAKMPRAKKPKLEASSKTDKASNHPSATDADGDNAFAQLARQHWLKKTKRANKVKVNIDVLKGEIWDPLQKEGFDLKSLLVLEGLQLLERCAMSMRPLQSWHGLAG
jgi:intron-binding protein aquarius